MAPTRLKSLRRLRALRFWSAWEAAGTRCQPNAVSSSWKECLICLDGAQPGAPLLGSPFDMGCDCAYEIRYACLVRSFVRHERRCPVWRPVCRGPYLLSPVPGALRESVESWLTNPNARVGDVGVAEHGCWAIENLAGGGSDGLREQLMDAGAAARIVAAMEAHVGHAGVAAKGCAAIANLSVGSDCRREQLVDAGAAERIVAAMEAHVRHASVSSAGCLAIDALAGGGSDGVREQLRNAGAAVRIVAAMEAHIGVSLVGCFAMERLARGSNGQRDALGAAAA